MISDGAIKLLANKCQTTEQNVRREYLQQLFLSAFYQRPETDQIYFKGGTALRIIHNSPRFSEDLDFSSSLNQALTIEQAILGTLETLERGNIHPDIRESKNTSGGYLAIISFKSSKYPISIQMDISLRKREATGEAVTVVSEYLPAYTIISLQKEQFIDEKIQALLTRKKARDFYDLYFILRANLLPPQKRGLLIQVQKLLKLPGINFEKELKEFLPKSHWSVIRDFPTVLAQEVQRYL